MAKMLMKFDFLQDINMEQFFSTKLMVFHKQVTANPNRSEIISFN